MQDEPLTPGERDAFSKLGRDADPPAGLEDRVVGRLRARGILRSRRQAVAGWQAAAAILVFALGFVTGRADFSAAPAEAESRYLLLLYGADSMTPAEEAARVAEYGAWARNTLGPSLVTAAKLTNLRRVLGEGATIPAPEQQPTGFFLISAADRQVAEALAASCPHLRHGGTVVVREVDETAG